MTTIKGTKTPKKFSTQLSEGSWGYGGGTRVYKSKLPTIKNTYTNPKPVEQITRFPKQSAVTSFKNWLARSPYKYSKNTPTRKIKNVFSVNKNTQNLIMSTKNVKTGVWTRKKITSKEFSELK